MFDGWMDWLIEVDGKVIIIIIIIITIVIITIITIITIIIIIVIIVIVIVIIIIIIIIIRKKWFGIFISNHAWNWITTPLW